MYNQFSISLRTGAELRQRMLDKLQWPTENCRSVADEAARQEKPTETKEERDAQLDLHDNRASVDRPHAGNRSGNGHDNAKGQQAPHVATP